MRVIRTYHIKDEHIMKIERIAVYGTRPKDMATNIYHASYIMEKHNGKKPSELLLTKEDFHLLIKHQPAEFFDKGMKFFGIPIRVVDNQFDVSYLVA